MISALNTSDLADGDQIFVMNGSKYVRRIDANNENKHRLMIAMFYLLRILLISETVAYIGGRYWMKLAI